MTHPNSIRPLTPEQKRVLSWRDCPGRFVRQALRTTPEPWQEQVLYSLAHHHRVAVRSGHGVGKSALLAWAVLWWLLTRTPAKVACTAPTAHQLEDILWGEIAKWSRRLTPRLKAQFALARERLVMVAAPGQSFAVARTARRDQPEAFQGFHSEAMLFVVDEASGVEDAIFETGEGAMSTEGAKTLMAGNPTRSGGYFFDAFHRMRPRWQCFRVGCDESSRVTADYRADMATRHGIDSNIYRVRVMGEFPTTDDDAVIPLELCEAAVRRDVAVSPAFRPVWGVDVARFGSDRSALARRQGNVLLEPVTSWRGKDTMQLVGLIASAHAACGPDELPAEILVDSIGLGAGVVDRLRELGLPVRGINVAEAAPAGARFHRLRDELWFAAREWLAAADCRLPDDPELIAELTRPRYGVTSLGKVRIESKQTLGGASPDLADAFILTFAAHPVRRDDEALERYARRRRRPGSWMTA